jgi:hypothetical protein
MSRCTQRVLLLQRLHKHWGEKTCGIQTKARAKRLHPLHFRIFRSDVKLSQASPHTIWDLVRISTCYVFGSVKFKSRTELVTPRLKVFVSFSVFLDIYQDLVFVVPCIFNYWIKQPTRCTINIKFLLLCRVYTAQHVSGTVVPIIMGLLQLPMQPLVIVWLPGWTCFKLWSVTSNRPQLEASPTRKSYDHQRLHGQLEKAPDDGHNSARNMLSGVYATK